MMHGPLHGAFPGLDEAVRRPYAPGHGPLHGPPPRDDRSLSEAGASRRRLDADAPDPRDDQRRGSATTFKAVAR